MNDSLVIRVYENQRMVYESDEMSCPVELGRQKDGEDPPFFTKVEEGHCRLVIARREEDTISRRHILLEALPDQRLRLTNLRPQLPVRLADSRELKPLASTECSLPYLLTLGRDKTMRVAWAQPVDLQSLSEPTRAPGSVDRAFSRMVTLPLPEGSALNVKILEWLSRAMSVLHSATCSTDFMAQAAQAAVDLVRLDSCRILLLDAHGEWQTHSIKQCSQTPESEWKPSRKVLSRVRDEHKTFWQLPAAEGESSLVGIKAIVAAPILDRGGKVIGAFYGDRRHSGATTVAQAQITSMEAMLVELLASGVAAGLARTEMEKEVLRVRVQFEQFFTPKLSRQLAANPELLTGQFAEVSILFCDIRGFSRISERLGAARTFEWIGDVMGVLSECVLSRGGVVVDYIGDEIMAMWGAPEKQPDHAELACQAALDMLARMPAVNERWSETLQEPIGLGIGINTGTARVGNTGSPQKFKYGPLGDTVNLASRVQGANKYFKTTLLITESTDKLLGPQFERRRLGIVRVVNIDRPVELFEVAAPGRRDWATLKEKYEEALARFNAKELRAAARTLGNLQIEHPEDGPSLLLLSRAVGFIANESMVYDAILNLPGK